MDDPQIQALVTELAAKAGCRLDLEITRSNRSVNARVVNGRPAKLIVTGGLLEVLEDTPDLAAALRAIVAHELGHLAVGDLREIPLRARIFLALGLGIAMSGVALLGGAGLVGALGWYVAGGLVALAASLVDAFRHRRSELRADRYALALTGDRAALVAALQATDRADPLAPAASISSRRHLLDIHPSTSSRIAALD